MHISTEDRNTTLGIHGRQVPALLVVVIACDRQIVGAVKRIGNVVERDVESDVGGVEPEEMAVVRELVEEVVPEILLPAVVVDVAQEFVRTEEMS